MSKGLTKWQQEQIELGYRLASKGKPKPMLNQWMTAGWHDYQIIHRTGIY